MIYEKEKMRALFFKKGNIMRDEICGNLRKCSQLKKAKA